MRQQQFITVFDFLDRGYPVWPTLFGLMAVLAAVGVYFERKKMMPNRSPEMQLRLSIFFLGASIIITALITFKIFSEYMQITRAIGENKVKALEGHITHYVPLIDNMSAWEQFCLGATCFKYSDFVPSAAFNNTAKYGGPMKRDIYVRLYYTDGLIVKLEVLR